MLLSGARRTADDGDAAARTPLAQVDWSDGEVQGKGTNISMKGLFVETEERIAVDTPVMVEFSVITDEELARVVASGHVVRCFDARDTISGRMRSGLGIRFEMFLAGKRSLKRFVRERSQNTRSVHGMRVERRSHRRVAVSLPVSWQARGRPTRHGYLLRMPTPGLFALESKTLVATGTSLEICLALPGEPGECIEAKAEVRSLISTLDQAGGMVVEMDLSPVDMALVNRYAKRFGDGPTSDPADAPRSERARRRA